MSTTIYYSGDGDMIIGDGELEQMGLAVSRSEEFTSGLIERIYREWYNFEGVDDIFAGTEGATRYMEDDGSSYWLVPVGFTSHAYEDDWDAGNESELLPLYLCNVEDLEEVDREEDDEDTSDRDYEAWREW